MLLVVVLVLVSTSFFLDATGGRTPISFEGTNEGGLAFGAIYEARQTNAVIPRTEAFYAQYSHVEGYDGIPFLLNDPRDASQSREFITYMRGDMSAGGVTEPASGIDHYIHSDYEDIGPLYRKRIYKLGV